MVKMNSPASAHNGEQAFWIDGIKGSHYGEMVDVLKQRVPDIHIHAFSPFEIWYGSRLSKQEPADFLRAKFAYQYAITAEK